MSRIDPETIAVLDNPASTVPERLKASRLLIRYGELDRAVTYVSAMLEDAVLRPHAEVMLAQIHTLKRLGVKGAMQPAERADLGQGVEDVGYWVVPADSRTTVIAFTGRAMRLDISIYFMQRILKRFGVNVIYVFDWTDTYYFAGVKGLGDDSRSSAARLEQMCAELGTKRLICFGQSTGGYAAIRYGLKLGADGVLAFSPVILPVMQAPNLDRIEAALGRRPKLRSVDLRKVFKREPVVPYTKIVFGDGNRGDLLSARHLAGLPRVVTHPLAGVKVHGTVEATTLSGTFPEIFDVFCGEVGPGQWARRQRGISGRKSRGRRARARPGSLAAEGSPR